MKRFVLIAAFLFCAAQCVAEALPACPVLITFEACPGGSKRAYPWLLYEDRNGDGFYDYVTAGSCDGTTASRPLPSVTANPFDPTEYDVPLGELPQGAGVDSVGVYGVHVASGTGLYAWTVTEYHQGVAVCTYGRNDAGALASTCPPEYLGMLEPR